MIDYYKVLGVPHDATQELIKKTFSALTKIYHPDVYQGNKKYAKEKTQEINEAYKVLSSPESRKKYDEEIANNNSKKEESDLNDEFDENIQQTYSKIMEEDWNYACNFYPEIKIKFSELRVLSRLLAFQFQVLLLHDKSFEKYDEVASALESEYLTKKFGKRKDVQKLAKRAILSGNIDFAKELNKAIRILGEKAYRKILTELAKKYRKFADKYYKDYGFMSLNNQIDWEKNFIKGASLIFRFLVATHPYITIAFIGFIILIIVAI